MPGRWNGVLARLGTPTGDGRIITSGGATNRDLPLPLLWQRETEDGHGGSVIIGRIDAVEFGADMVTASGLLFDTYEAREAEQLIDAGVIGPSVDLDDMVYVYDEETDLATITSCRIAGATLVAIPAFAEVYIHMAAPEPEVVADAEGAPVMIDDYAAYDYDVMVASAADAAPRPPLEWFTNPMLTGPTPLTVTADGRVFGHIAQWGQCHVGLPGCVTAPQSIAEYGYFLTGVERTAEGTDVPVGRLTVGGGHATPELGFAAAVAHYDDVGTAAASVYAGEDDHGIWVSGWVIPGTPDAMISELLRHPPSGDWRSIGGNLELIAVCAVNSGGFPIKRPRVAFSLGRQRTLVGTFAPAPTGAPAPESLAAFHLAAAPAPAAPDTVPPTIDARAAWARQQWTQRSTT